MVIIACSGGSVTPLVTLTFALLPTFAGLVNLIPELAGDWQDGSRVL